MNEFKQSILLIFKNEGSNNFDSNKALFGKAFLCKKSARWKIGLAMDIPIFFILHGFEMEHLYLLNANHYGPLWKHLYLLKLRNAEYAEA